MRQPPFWSFKTSHRIKISDLLSFQGSQFARQEAVGAALLARPPPGRGVPPGAVRRGRGAEPAARGIAGAAPSFFRVPAVVAHQVVVGWRFPITMLLVVVVVVVGYSVDPITLLE